MLHFPCLFISLGDNREKKQLCGTGLSFYFILNTLKLSMVTWSPSMGGKEVMRQISCPEFGDFVYISVNFLKVFKNVPALLLWCIKHIVKSEKLALFFCKLRCLRHVYAACMTCEVIWGSFFNIWRGQRGHQAPVLDSYGVFWEKCSQCLHKALIISSLDTFYWLK